MIISLFLQVVKLIDNTHLAFVNDVKFHSYPEPKAASVDVPKLSVSFHCNHNLNIKGLAAICFLNKLTRIINLIICFKFNDKTLHHKREQFRANDEIARVNWKKISAAIPKIVFSRNLCLANTSQFVIYQHNLNFSFLDQGFPLLNHASLIDFISTSTFALFFEAYFFWKSSKDIFI